MDMKALSSARRIIENYGTAIAGHALNPLELHVLSHAASEQFVP